MITVEKNKYLRIYENFYDAYKTAETFFSNYVDLSKYKISSSVADGFEWHNIFHRMATDSVRELLSEINDFCFCIESLNSWSQIIEDSSEDDLLEICSFMRPIAFAAINSPNCIKNRFLHYAVVLLRETFTLYFGRSSDCCDFSDDEIERKTLLSFAQPAKELDLKSFNLFLSLRDNINQNQFIEGTSNFRNRYHHQRPPHVQIGLMSLAQRTDDFNLEFSKYRFNKVCTIEGLCKAINNDFSELSLKEPDNTIERLNEILKISNLYNIYSKLDLIDPYRIGVAIATGIGGGECKENQHIIFMEKGVKRISPFTAVMICAHSAAGIISCELGVKGPNITISSGCTSGLDAIYSAYNAIQLGDADIMFAGAGEAPITPYIIAIFCAAGLLSRNNGEPERTIKPYDSRGEGTVLGEGGAILILEELQSALKRKAKIYGEILGYASCNEAYNIFRIDPSGEATAMVMKKAIEIAHLSIKDIDYINAHGNGSPEYDLNETVAIKKVFGELANSIPVTSIKPITGQSFSVAGILQMITCLSVIKHGIIPPTMNHTIPSIGCDLDYVPNRFRKKEVNIALMNALGYGGGHTALIAGRFNY